MYKVTLMAVLGDMVRSVEVGIGAQLSVLVSHKVVLGMGMVDGNNSLGLSRGTRLSMSASNDLGRSSSRRSSIRRNNSSSSTSRSHDQEKHEDGAAKKHGIFAFMWQGVIFSD